MTNINDKLKHRLGGGIDNAEARAIAASLLNDTEVSEEPTEVETPIEEPVIEDANPNEYRSKSTLRVNTYERPEPQNTEETYLDIMDKAMAEANEKNAKIIKELNEKAAAEAKAEEDNKVAENTVVTQAEVSTSDEGYSSVDDIIKSFDEEEHDISTSEEEEIDAYEERINEYFNTKAYATYETDTERTGPADYIVEDDPIFQDALDSVLSANDVRYTNVSDKDRYTILEQFKSGNTKISIELPSSGMFIQFTGAGVDELMAMERFESNSEAEEALTRLGHVASHISNSTVGPMKLSNLVDLVSFYDLDTLYYGLFAATHPDKVEVSSKCPGCQRDYFIELDTKSLLTNPEDFTKAKSDIRNNITTRARFVERSQIGKIFKKVTSSGMIVAFKHPSIKSYYRTLSLLDEKLVDLYGSDAYQITFMLDSIALPYHGKKNKNDDKPTYVVFKNPNEIIQIIGNLRDPAEKYEIQDAAEDLFEVKLPAYGYKETKCPHCGKVNEGSVLSMQQLLFTVAAHENGEARLKHDLKLIEKRRKKEKKDKNA